MEEEDKRIIESNSEPFYLERFLYKNKNFEDLKFLEEHQKSDLYSIYHATQYQYKDTEDELWDYTLSKLDKSMFKFLTKDNASYCDRLLPIFYKHVNKIYEAKAEEDKKKEEEQGEGGQDKQDGQSQGQGQGKGDKQEGEGEGISDALKELIEQQANEAEESVQEALKEMRKEEEQANQQAISKQAGNGNGETRLDADPKIVMNLLKRVNLNSYAVDEFIKKTIKTFRSHFSNIFTYEMESILEAEEIDDIEGIELLPFVKKFPFLWDEIYNLTKVYGCVVDCYVDYSGSMDSEVNISPDFHSFTRKGNGEFVTMMNLSKVLMYKLYSDNILADLYAFTHSVDKHDINTGLNRRASGGTNINCVIQNIHKTNRPSLIISDGNDTITEYSDLAYIINVDPSSFEGMVSRSTDAVKKMLANEQIMCFVDNKFLNKEQFNKYKKLR